MKGKEKCKALKEIRKKIADENDIPYVVEECSHKGECKGTCPKCEAELRYLERELERKEKIGKKLAVVGVSMGIAASFAGCDFDDAMEVITYPGVVAIETVENIFGLNQPTLEGDVQYVDGDMGYIDVPELEGEPTYPDYEIGGDVDYIDVPELEGEPTIPDYEIDGDVDYIDDGTDGCKVEDGDLEEDNTGNIEEDIEENIDLAE
ncbi:MAG: hypothetical protein MJ126_03185 [Lachnospiraceae bacterium]|nr:hypothetical protein [Lachnospiraceae bacterium]